MSNYKSVTPDREILKRITEDDVATWMVTRLELLRSETELPFHLLDLAAAHRLTEESSPYVNWVVHTPEACESAATINRAAEQLMAKIGDAPTRAKSKREQAAKLLAEAEALDGGKLVAMDRRLDEAEAKA